jgi:hypothetical protein
MSEHQATSSRNARATSSEFARDPSGLNAADQTPFSWPCRNEPFDLPQKYRKTDPDKPAVSRSSSTGRWRLIYRKFYVGRRNRAGKCSPKDQRMGRIERRQRSCTAGESVSQLTPAKPVQAPPSVARPCRKVCAAPDRADMCSLTLGMTGGPWRRPDNRTGFASCAPATIRLAPPLDLPGSRGSAPPRPAPDRQQLRRSIQYEPIADER